MDDERKTLGQIKKGFEPINNSDYIAVTQRRRSRLLGLILLIILIGYIVLLISQMIGTQFKFIPEIGIPILCGVFTTLISYILNNRLRLTQLAAAIFLVSTIFIVLGYIYATSDAEFISNLRGTSSLLTIPVIIAGVILGPSSSFVIASISIAGMITVGIARSHVGFDAFENPADVMWQLSVPITVLVVMGGLSWLFERNIQLMLAHMVAQNRHLDRVNRELSKRQFLEQQLSRQVDQLTGQVSGAFDDQNRTTADQLEAVLRVSTTIEELSQTSEAISRAAAQVNSTAQQALHIVSEGSEMLRTGLGALNRLNGQALEVANAMHSLAMQAQQIDQILELINELSEETNLLALNAKIEAAGAGEFGRRFSTVANEVQRLANRSREATIQVRQVIEETQGAIERSSMVAQRNMTEANDAMSGTRSIEIALEGIVSMVENNAMLAGQISNSIQEQRSATVQVVETMRHISTISNSVAEGSQDVLQNLMRLREAVTRLNTLNLEKVKNS